MTVYTATANQTPPVNSLTDGDTLVLTASNSAATATGLLVQGTKGSTLELAGPGGTLSGLGSNYDGFVGSYVGFGTINVDPGSNWTLTGTNVMQPGDVLNLGASSTLTVSNGTLSNNGNYYDTTPPARINFEGAGTVTFDNPASVNITGFGLDDVIRFSGLDDMLAMGPYGNARNMDIITAGYWSPQSGNSQLRLTFADQSLQGNRSYTVAVVDYGTLAITIAPQITSITATAPNGTLGQTGDVLTFTLTTDAPVTFYKGAGAMNPVLHLSTGNVATYDAADSTSTSLVFHHTVATGDFTSDLKVTGLDLLGSPITDAVGGSLDPASVPTLSGADTGLTLYGAPNAPAAPTGSAAAPTVPPVAPVTPNGPGGSGQVSTSTVIVVTTGSGTTVTTPSGAANTVYGQNSGNGIVIAQGSDTINAGAGNLTVYATGGATVLGGTGNLTVVSNGSPDFAVGGSGTNLLYGGGKGSYLFAGTGNSTLVGGTGSNAIMYGNSGATSFVGSAGGSDIMVGGTGTNTFSMTSGNVAFGGTTAGDSFNMGTGSALIVQGSAASEVLFGGGAATAFAGTGTDTYTVTKGMGGVADLIGFKAGDMINLTGGFTADDESSAVAGATRGSFGTTLSLVDGTQINLFGVSLSAAQITLG